jgi:hypothetical protein
MHALNSHIAKAGDTIYALIPTYYNPSHFIECKLYVEYAWHSVDAVYYHGIVVELLGDAFKNLKVLSTANVKAISRDKNELKMVNLAMPTLFDNERMLAHLQIIQRDYRFDVPGPFVAANAEDFAKLKDKVKQYFTSLANHFG